MRKEEKLKAKGKRKDIPVECRVPRKARRDKKAFLHDQCKEIKENNRMGKTRGLFKKKKDGNKEDLQNYVIKREH